MKIPRDLSGSELARRAARLGYSVTRQTGSHMRLTRTGPEGETHVTVPRHDPLKVGTLSGILGDLSEQLGLSKQDVLDRLLD